MSKLDNKNPWFLAVKEKRDYITPEDIEEAIKNGADKTSLYKEVLLAISAKACEDVSLCAFIAVKTRRSKNNA